MNLLKSIEASLDYVGLQEKRTLWMLREKGTRPESRQQEEDSKENSGD